MIQSVPETNREALLQPVVGRWFDWIGQLAVGQVHGVLRLCGLTDPMTELQLSREWLEEYERRSRKHSGDL